MTRIVVLALVLLSSVSIAEVSIAEAQGGMIPRHCGLQAGYETYGPIVPGVVVVLGMHTPWAGDANWSAEMNAFVGRQARVTQLAGVDAAGCPVVRVDADAGQYFWRVRDMQIAAGVVMDIPRGCDMTPQTVTYGPIGPGSVVMLGAHSPWRGDSNWAPEMVGWVGRMARVTSYEGVDSVGCPVVRVDADGGQYYWRIRDMQLAGPSMPMVAAAVPRWCGMDDRSATWGPIAPGAVVTLGRHSPWSGDTNWSYEMERFVGVRATVTQLAGLDDAGCPGIRVDVDGGQWFWRVRDLGY